MEINKINYKKPITPQNIAKRPKSQRWYVRLLIMLVAFFLSLGKKIKYKRINMESLKKTPYLLLCNHMQFLDFPIAAKANRWRRLNNVVTLDAFDIKAGLMLRGGCIITRKFVNDGVSTVRNMHYAMSNLKSVASLYPEANYTRYGTAHDLPESLGKMIKLWKVPVVTLILNGAHLLNPRWGDQKTRKSVPVIATLKQILTAEQVAAMTAEEINAALKTAFEYDEYKYWRETGFKIKYKNRAKGIHNILYKCPHCQEEYHTVSGGSEVSCAKCGSVWELTEDGELVCKTGETRFKYVPDWCEWQRAEVKKELLAGTYEESAEMELVSMPGVKNVIKLGTAKLTHNMDGFVAAGHYNGKDFKIVKTPLENYSLQVEFFCNTQPAFKKRHMLGLSVTDDSFYFFPTIDGMMMKMYFATEELYKLKKDTTPAVRR